MNYTQQLYFYKDNEKVVRENLRYYLLYQIYSPEVIRQAYVRWPELNWSIRENTPTEIQEIIRKSPLLLNKELRTKLNAYQINQALSVLRQYQSCDTPITQNPCVPKNRYNLLSPKGEKALKILSQAQAEKHFTNKMVDLAVESGHKFLGKDCYFYHPKIKKKFAQKWAFEFTKASDKTKVYMFPTIQLTRGCLNHCSHCDSRAEPVLSHMPWPFFRALYREMHQYYRHYPQKETDFYFSSFFADSDMLDYVEPISRVDSGDVGLWITAEKGDCQYLTRGVKSKANKLALAKAIYSGQPIGISFVDTPKENMPQNIKQLNDTLDVVESVSDRKADPTCIHLHLKSGPTVSASVFRGFPLEQTTIYALGRAKELPQKEVAQHPDSDFLPKIIFNPDGHMDFQEVKNGEVKRTHFGFLFNRQQGPKISKYRLFMRRLFQKLK